MWKGFIKGLTYLGDFIWWGLENFEELIGGLLDLALNGSGKVLEGVDLIHKAHRYNRDGLPRMEELGAKRNWELYRLSYRDKYGVWPDSQASPPRRDPLVLDLNRDGKVELKNAAFFDLNANGFHEFTRWIDKTDAFLVLDKNFNGKADDGSELFGDAMTLPDGSLALTGFDALKAYDSNGDGKIDASDEIYASLKVLTGEGKMSSLADAGIKSLNVASEAVNENTPPALSQSDLANRSAA